MSVNAIIKKYSKYAKKQKFDIKNKETQAWLIIGGISIAALYFILTKQKSGVGVFDQIAGGIGAAGPYPLEGRGAGVLPMLPGGEVEPMDEGAVKEAAFTDWYATTQSSYERLIIA